jgi:hypothetical protein
VDFLEDFAAFFAAPSVEDGDAAAAMVCSGGVAAAADGLESTSAAAGGAAEEEEEAAATVASVATDRADDDGADGMACSGRATILARAMRAEPRHAADAAAWRRQRHRSKAVAISVASIDRGVMRTWGTACGAARRGAPEPLRNSINADGGDRFSGMSHQSSISARRHFQLSSSNVVLRCRDTIVARLVGHSVAAGRRGV